MQPLPWHTGEGRAGVQGSVVPKAGTCSHVKQGTEACTWACPCISRAGEGSRRFLVVEAAAAWIGPAAFSHQACGHLREDARTPGLQWATVKTKGCTAAGPRPF